MKKDTVISHSEILHALRHGIGFVGWGADQHAVNHSKEHVWFEKITGGYTECCIYGEECPHHAKLRIIEDEENNVANRVIENDGREG